MVATYIINYDRENLASLVVAADDLRKKARELDRIAVSLAEDILEDGEDEE